MPEIGVSHKTSHQDGGGDEISVAALSGQLADPQPSTWTLVSGKPSTFTPEAHKTSHQDGGSDEISLIGLAGLTVTEQPSSWGQVSGKPSTFPPEAHKTSHQDGGSDEINASGLTGRVNFVDRGDPLVYDFYTLDFTTDNTWRDLDLSSIVPSGTIAALLRILIRDDNVGNFIVFRKKGNISNVNVSGPITQTANVYNSKEFIVFVDSNRFIQYLGSNTTFTDIILLVKGWFI